MKQEAHDFSRGRKSPLPSFLVQEYKLPEGLIMVRPSEVDLQDVYEKLKELNREYSEKLKLVEGYIEEALKVLGDI
jgi:hypothetical protein